jgi:hypothetical protein
VRLNHRPPRTGGLFFVPPAEREGRLVPLASGCICGRRFLQESNEGTCLMCGHGWLADTVELHAPADELEAEPVGSEWLPDW